MHLNLQLIFIDLSFQIVLRTLISISSPPVLGLLLKSLQKNNTYKKDKLYKSCFFLPLCEITNEKKLFFHIRLLWQWCELRLSISVDVHDNVHGCTQMYGDQSGVNFIVIFYTKNLRIKWSNITKFHEFCTKCFARHSIMLVLWSFRSGTGLEYIFSPYHEEHNYFSFVESGKRWGAGGEFKIYKETSHRPRTGKHVCIPQVRHSHKNFSSFLQNNLSEYRLPPPYCSCTDFKTRFKHCRILSNLQTRIMINKNVVRSASCKQKINKRF